MINQMTGITMILPTTLDLLTSRVKIIKGTNSDNRKKKNPALHGIRSFESLLLICGLIFKKINVRNGI